MYTQPDIAAFLSAIDEPGKSRDEKISAIRQLNISNFQGILLEDTLTSYEEF